MDYELSSEYKLYLTLSCLWFLVVHLLATSTCELRSKSQKDPPREGDGCNNFQPKKWVPDAIRQTHILLVKSHWDLRPKIRLRSTFATFVARQALKLVTFRDLKKIDLYCPFYSMFSHTILIYLKIQRKKKKHPPQNSKTSPFIYNWYNNILLKIWTEISILSLSSNPYYIVSETEYLSTNLKIKNIKTRAVTSCYQETGQVVSCLLSCDRTGDSYWKMPFETPGGLLSPGDENPPVDRTGGLLSQTDRRRSVSCGSP